MAVNDLPDFMAPRQLGGFRLLTSDQVFSYPFVGPQMNTSPFDGAVIDFHNREVGCYYQLELSRVTGSPPGLHGMFTKIVAGPGDQGSVRIPLLDDVAQFSVSILAGSSTPLLDWQVRGVSGWPSNWSQYGGTPRINAATSILAANGSDTIAPGQWYAGRVQMTVTSDTGGPAWVQMRYWDYTNMAFTDFAYFGVSNRTTGVPIELTFPSAPVQIVIHNGATAQTVTTIVVPAASGGY